MEAFNQQKAIERYTQLFHLAAIGACDERQPDGSYGEDGVELTIANLEHQAEQSGLQFWIDGPGWKLQPITEPEKAERHEALLAEVSNVATWLVEGDISFFKVEETRIYELLPGGSKWYVEVICQHIDDPTEEGVTLLCRVAYDYEVGFLRAKRINSLLDV
jgi:hypothetical protein